MQSKEEKKKAHREYMQAWRVANPEKNKKYMKEYRRANPAKYLEYGRRYRTKLGKEGYQRKRLWDNHRLPLEDFLRKKQEQNGLCAICLLPNRNVRHHDLLVDHNHKTGDIRGLLCHACNLVVGWCREDTTILENTIEYLKKHGQGRK